MPEWFATTRARAVGRDVLDPAHVDAEPVPEQRSQERQEDGFGELLVVAERIDIVIAGQAPPQERDSLSNPLLAVGS